MARHTYQWEATTIVQLSSTLAILVLVATVALMVVSLIVAVVSARRANQRSERLLQHMLTPAELAQLNRCEYLDVPSPSQLGTLYRIPARAAAIRVVSEGKVLRRLCIRPCMDLPGREHVLAHKLLIETSEAEYVRRANIV